MSSTTTLSVSQPEPGNCSSAGLLLDEVYKPAHSAIRRNLTLEKWFSPFNGVIMGLTVFASLVVAVKGINAPLWQVTILIMAFPLGALLGPAWAVLGRRWGMQNLVVRMGVLASVSLFGLFWVHSSLLFVLIISFSQMLLCAMRLGQVSLYRMVYPNQVRGRVLGTLLFWTYVTMVPAILLAGWLIDRYPESYRLIYPAGGVCGLVSCWFYSRIRPSRPHTPSQERTSLRAGLRRARMVLGGDRPYLHFQIALFLSGSAFFLSTHVVLEMTAERFHFSATALALWLSVVPQILLALGSPTWGRILDRFGIERCRMLMSVIMTAYLASYFTGLVSGIPLLIIVGGILEGISRGGGQMTWALASTQFAPRAEDLPLYNGIHFVLNGIRGLLCPWVGLVLYWALGSGTVLVATLVSLASIPVLVQAPDKQKGR
jgi:MFS family permease